MKLLALFALLALSPAVHASSVKLDSAEIAVDASEMDDLSFEFERSSMTPEKVELKLPRTITESRCEETGKVTVCRPSVLHCGTARYRRCEGRARCGTRPATCCFVTNGCVRSVETQKTVIDEYKLDFSRCQPLAQDQSEDFVLVRNAQDEQAWISPVRTERPTEIKKGELWRSNRFQFSQKRD